MANVTFTFNPEPAPACYPADVNGLAQLLTNGGMLAGSVPDNAGGGVFVGVNPPPSAITNKVWFKIDGIGRPVGVYMFYGGNWRKVYTGVTVGEIRMVLYYSGFFDGTGRGIVGGEYDGWAMCNGQNGTPNLQNAFMQAGEPNGAGGWNSWNPTAGAWTPSGGQAQTTFKISPVNLPPLQIGLWQFHFLYQGGGTPADASVFYTAGSKQFTPVLDQNQQPIGSQQGYTLDNTPPWIAMGFLMFIGY